MRTRPLGKTSIMVSEIGFGAWGIGGSGWVGAQDEDSLAALHAAIDAGVTLIDTALAYGTGHSESLIGQVVRARRERVYVATKIPPLNGWVPALRGSTVQQAFPPDHVVSCTHNSLRHLKLDCIDLQQLHVWRDEWLDDLSWLDALRKLKEAGKIRWLGVSLNHHEPESSLRLVRSGVVDAVQVIYNIFDQSPAAALLPACLEHQVGVLVRCPFDEGGLTGTIGSDTQFPPGDFRSHYFSGDRKVQVAARVHSLRSLLGDEARTLPELALRFCLAHPAVSTVLAGMRTRGHVVENCAVSDGRQLSDVVLHELQNHAWSRNFYESDPHGLVGRMKRLAKKVLPLWLLDLLQSLRR